jgi:hypothetical protein
VIAMKKTALAVVTLCALAACATTDPQKSYTPQVTVVVKAPKARSAQARRTTR